MVENNGSSHCTLQREKKNQLNFVDYWCTLSKNTWSIHNIYLGWYCPFFILVSVLGCISMFYTFLCVQNLKQNEIHMCILAGIDKNNDCRTEIHKNNKFNADYTNTKYEFDGCGSVVVVSRTWCVRCCWYRGIFFFVLMHHSHIMHRIYLKSEKETDAHVWWVWNVVVTKI